MIKKLLLAAALLVPAIASAQSLKIGLVNTNDVISAMPETAAAQTTLNDMKNKYEAEYNKLGEEFQRQVAEFQKMPETELAAIRDRKARELQDQQQKLQVFEQQSMEDLQKKQGELMQPVITKVRNAIESVGKENGYSLIQDNASQMTLYFAAPVEDVTPLVKAKLGLK